MKIGFLQQNVEVIKLVTTACIILHNIIRVKNPRAHQELMDTYDSEGKLKPGAWRQGVEPEPNDDIFRGVDRRQFGNPGMRWAKQVRDYLSEYFSDPNRGAKDWQWEGVFRYTDF